MNLLISRTLLTLLATALLCSRLAAATDTAPANPIVVLHTTKGDITLELNPQKAPVTVANFLDYANSGFYNGTVFHRVIKRFMIQGGGFDQALEKKPTRDPIINESRNGLHNDRYTIAMARTDEPDSATSQFFINTRINAKLDAIGRQPGYTVFGKVIEGNHVVTAIAKTATQSYGEFADLPVEPIVITSVELLNRDSH